MDFDFLNMITLREEDADTVKLLRLILAYLSGNTQMINTGTKKTPSKRTVTGSGTISGVRSVTFIVRSSDAYIDNDQCFENQSYSFSDGIGLEDITYNTGSGKMELLEII